MRIGLDLDGVVYNFDKTAQYMLARHKGYTYREDLPWNPDEYYRGVPEEDWGWLFNDENIDPLFRHGHLYRGAIEFVRELAEWGDVVIVTKRPHRALPVTLEWLTYHGFAKSIREVHVLDDGVTKSAVKCNVYIDDQVEVLRGAVMTPDWGAPLARAILMDRPWNKGAWEIWFTRVVDFAGVFTELSRRRRT